MQRQHNLVVDAAAERVLAAVGDDDNDGGFQVEGATEREGEGENVRG